MLAPSTHPVADPFGSQDAQRNRTGGMATAGTQEDPHLICITGDGASKGVVIGHFPGSTELLNQSSADVTKWLLYQEMHGEDNLVLRARLKQLMPDLSRIYQTKELLPGGLRCEPRVFVELVLTADRPFLRHATGCSGNSADAFGAPHCKCHGDKLYDFTMDKKTHHGGLDFETLCAMAHVPLHEALGLPTPRTWKFTCPCCNQVCM